MSLSRSFIVALRVLLLLAVPSVSFGQVRIHGLITDVNNEPVEFATVRVGGTVIGTTSGLKGEYSLSCPEADTITVHFSCIGFRDLTRVLVDRPTGDVTLNVRMQFTSNQLKQVEVTELKKQTGAMSTIDTEALRRSPDATGGSVESLLATQAGVHGADELSSRYSVRGGAYDENSVYINGIEVYRPQLISSGQQEGLSIINPDLVGAIGFSTGGYPAEYGDNISSVLDITYRSPSAFEGSVTGSLMGGSVALGHGGGRFSQLHGVRYKSTSSLLSSMDTKGEYDPRYFDYQTSLTYRFSDRFDISFLGNISVNRYLFTPVDRSTDFGTVDDARRFTVYFDGHEKDRFETWFGALSLGYRLSRSTALKLVASGFLSDELVSYDISGEYWLDQAGSSQAGGELGVGRYHEHARNRLRTSVMALDMKGATAFSGGHTLSYGLSVRSEKIMDRSREWELRDSAGFTLPSVPDELRMIYALDSHQDLSSVRFSAFVQDAWKFSTSSGFFTLNGGLRLSHWDFNRETVVSPRFSAGFIPEKYPSWVWRMSAGLYYQAPFYKQYRVPEVDAHGNIRLVPNDDIKSQRSLHFIAGTDYTFRALGRPFKFSAEVYYKLLSDMVPYEIDNLRLVYSGLNESSGYATGIDMRLFGQFVPGSDSWISLSLMRTREDIHGVKVPLPTDRAYSVGLFFNDYFPRFPRLRFSLRGIFMQGLPSTSPHTSRADGYFRMPPYKRLDAGLQYALLAPPKDGEARTGLGRALKSVWIGVDLFNLLDISNVSSYYWVTDVNDIRYAVPNYLTGRQFNVRFSIDF